MKSDGDGAGAGDALGSESQLLDELTLDDLIELADSSPDGKIPKNIRDALGLDAVPSFGGPIVFGPACDSIYTVPRRDIPDFFTKQLPELMVGSAKASAPRIVQPKGSQWPHKKGARWTEEEREAMFLMRHRDGVSDDDLAKIVGSYRQAINEVIGPKRPAGGLSKIKAKSGNWTPPTELLKECRAPLQSLQSLQNALAPLVA